MVDFLKAHKVWLITLAAGLVTFFEPSMKQYVATHPQSAVIVSTLWGIAAAWAKSPRQ